MAIVAFDIGGTSVKYGLWENGLLRNKGSFSTPSTWLEMKGKIKKIYDEFSKEVTITAAGFSFPGSVSPEEGVIYGISAIPYIHHFPIQAELERALKVPVRIENDANCAALAELWQGVAVKAKNVLFVVAGTGIGGSVIVNREIIRGSNLFGGEFGCMLLNKNTILSTGGSVVQAAERYSVRIGEKIDGKELFRRLEEGDCVAIEEIDIFLDSLSQGIHNLLVCFNPELLVLGGAISARDGIVEQLTERVRGFLKISGAVDINVNIVPCHFHNDANLIGAVSVFEGN